MYIYIYIYIYITESTFSDKYVLTECLFQLTYFMSTYIS